MKAEDAVHTSIPKELITKLVASSLMLLTNVYLFVPFSIYQGNFAEFEAEFLQIIGSQWIVILFSWLLLLAPLALVQRHAKSVRHYAVLLFIIACFTWLQSTLLMWDYGEFDGRGLDFSPFRVWGGLDLMVLAILLLSGLRYSYTIATGINTVALIFIAGQFALLFTGVMDRGLSSSKDLPQTELPSGFSEISSGRNIFHFVLDSAQSDVFLELIDEASLREEFAGFTLFLENAAVTPHTAFAIPSIFSGELYDGSQSPESFFSQSVQNGFHGKLYHSGYNVGLVPLLSMKEGPHNDYYKIPSNYRGSGASLTAANAAKLMDATLFRVSPHLLRIAIYDGGNWFLSRADRERGNPRSLRERAFLKDYIDGLEVQREKPTYHFIHLWPPHPPFATLADGSYAGEVLPNTRENYKNEMTPLVELLARLIRKLKLLGVYDEAALIVQGDHGSIINPIVDGRSTKPCLNRLPALLAVKRPQIAEPLRVSTARTSLLNVADTIMNIAGQGKGGVFSIDPDSERRRPYFSYENNQIVRHWINGSVYDAGSCQEAGIGNIEGGAATYQMGSTLEFGMQGNASVVTGYGWGQPMNKKVWSTAKVAALKFTIAENERHSDLIMDVAYRPYLDKVKVPSQRVNVLINGQMISEWVEDTPGLQERSVRIPAEMVQREKLLVEFGLPDAVSPASLGLGGDKRRLGIALRRVRLRTAVSIDYHPIKE